MDSTMARSEKASCEMRIASLMLQGTHRSRLAEHTVVRSSEVEVESQELRMAASRSSSDLGGWLED
jgi:hypothetical protein